MTNLWSSRRFVTQGSLINDQLGTPLGSARLVPANPTTGIEEERIDRVRAPGDGVSTSNDHG